MTTDNTRLCRRAYLKLAGGGLALGASTGLANSQNESDELARQLNGVRAATRRYRDVDAARAAGYKPIDEYGLELGYFSGQGFHFTDRWPPTGTDREDPPLLVYFTNGSYNPEPGDLHDPAHDDDLILGAVEYLVFGAREDNPPDIFADESSPRKLRVTEAEGWHTVQPGDRPVTALHAWVHRGNPAGVFHETNPTIE